MINNKQFDVIIIGGSYSGLAAGMALGRALKKVLIIDDGKPCNRQTPYSHNFITHDGDTPAEIAALANLQVSRYDTVKFFHGLATSGCKTERGFEIQVASRETFAAKKIIFATGIRDMLPDIDGLAACWGISVLHCPYCHGYEVRHEKTGILGNGEAGFDFARLISNWTNDLILFTNGDSTLTAGQSSQLKSRNIKIIEKEIERLEHSNGYLQNIIFKDGTRSSLKALYSIFNSNAFDPRKKFFLKIFKSSKIEITSIDLSDKNATESIICISVAPVIEPSSIINAESSLFSERIFINFGGKENLQPFGAIILGMGKTKGNLSFSNVSVNGNIFSSIKLI